LKFFHTNVILENTTTQFIVGPPKRIFSLQTLLTIYIVEISEIFSTSFETNVIQDYTVTSVKIYFFQNFGTCTRNGSFGVVLVKT